MKAEWGIVVSRGLLETRSYGHRFKFARAVVPPFVMELARGLSSSLVPIVTEREDVPDKTSSLSCLYYLSLSLFLLHFP